MDWPDHPMHWYQGGGIFEGVEGGGNIFNPFTGDSELMWMVVNILTCS